MNKVWIADLQILGSAFFFGIGFIGQRAVSVDGLGPMTCNALRFALSALLLVVVLPWIPPKWLNHGAESGASTEKDELLHHPLDDDYEIDDKDTRRDELKSSRGADIFPKFFNNIGLGNAQKTVLFWGLYLGGINFLGSGLQQWGISLISANKVAFIAGFDLFLTPIFTLFIPSFKRNGKPTPSTWLAVSISILGLYLLSDADITDFTMGRGEILTVISTFFWTLHITYTDIATTYVDTLHMMTVQLTIVAFLSSVAAVLLEPQGWFWHHILLFVPWMLFLAVVEGLGFTLMAMGQNFSPPTHAPIILSLERVFASIASYFCLGETLSHRELIGCSLMLVATYIAKIGCGCIEEGGSLSGTATAVATSAGNANDSILTSPQKEISTTIKGNSMNFGGMILFRLKTCVNIPLMLLKDCMVTSLSTLEWMYGYFSDNLRNSNGGGASGSGGLTSGVGSAGHHLYNSSGPLISREAVSGGNNSSSNSTNSSSSINALFGGFGLNSKDKGVIKI